MGNRNEEQTRERWTPDERPPTTAPSQTENVRNFEQSVSDINTDPDAGFDFDMNPTDDEEMRRSER
jgi:hypothetical protein